MKLFSYVQYTPTINIWSIRCIFAELLQGNLFCPGEQVIHVYQLDLMTNMLGIPSAEAIERSSVPFQFSQLHCYFFGWNACTQCDMLGTVKLEGTWAAWGRRSLFLSHISLYMLILLLFVYKKKCCLLNPRTYVFSDLTKLKTIPIYDFNF